MSQKTKIVLPDFMEIDPARTEFLKTYYLTFGTLEKIDDFLLSCGGEKQAMSVLEINLAMR